MALIISAQYADICLAWRDDRSGPMRVVSGPVGRERVHYEAPAASRLDAEMAAFLKWFNEEATLDPVLKAALAHLWFVTVHRHGAARHHRSRQTGHPRPGRRRGAQHELLVGECGG